eukprot:m51a1_g3075 hypothetical protein (290) ;mRNA; f:35436-36305
MVTSDITWVFLPLLCGFALWMRVALRPAVRRLIPGLASHKLSSAVVHLSNIVVFSVALGLGAPLFVDQVLRAVRGRDAVVWLSASDNACAPVLLFDVATMLYAATIAFEVCAHRSMGTSIWAHHALTLAFAGLWLGLRWTPFLVVVNGACTLLEIPVELALMVYALASLRASGSRWAVSDGALRVALLACAVYFLVVKLVGWALNFAWIGANASEVGAANMAAITVPLLLLYATQIDVLRILFIMYRNVGRRARALQASGSPAAKPAGEGELLDLESVVVVVPEGCDKQ